METYEKPRNDTLNSIFLSSMRQRQPFLDIFRGTSGIFLKFRLLGRYKCRKDRTCEKEFFRRFFCTKSSVLRKNVQLFFFELSKTPPQNLFKKIENNPTRLFQRLTITSNKMILSKTQKQIKGIRGKLF